MSQILETDRMIVRHMTVDDSEFILELLNDPSWIRFIGDRGARTTEDARQYILNVIIAMYDRLGFGLYLTELKSGSIPIGICGLIKRDSLEDVDIGFAFLPTFRGNGYAYESSSAMLQYGRSAFGLNRIVAITSQDNASSVGLLTKLGFEFERMVKLSDGEQEDMLFASSLECGA